MIDTLQAKLSLLLKLGSIAVHAEEMLSPGGHACDRAALESCCPTQKSRTGSKTWAYIFQRRDEYGRYRKWVLPFTSKIAVSRNIFPSTPTRDSPTTPAKVNLQSWGLSRCSYGFKAQIRNAVFI
jgi:hypothetical protein